jgi:uncharacterized protein (TIGR00730 family)
VPGTLSPMRGYDLGNPELDQLITDLVAKGSDNANADLIGEMIVTALKLHRDAPDRGELKLINTALKEMRYSNLVFSRHEEPKVTVFGSARLPESDPNYQLAMRFSAIMAERNWGVVTGAGPGIMEAGNRGAGMDASYGVNIRLPFEANANAYVSPGTTVNFKYFFTRKLGFVKESHAFALFPGGFGTLDETFELLTLIQTGKSDLHPIVLIEEEGTGYWEPLIAFMKEVLVAKGLIGIDDLTLFTFTTDPEVAAEELCRFYANFHSQRYVAGTLVLRLHRVPDADMLARLNAEYADILVDGSIEPIEPTPDEIADGDALDCQRLAMRFDRRHYGRLRQLIDELNTVVATPHNVHPPAPFNAVQADRTF